MKITNSINFIKEHNLNKESLFLSFIFSSIEHLKTEKNLELHFFEKSFSSDLILFKNLKIYTPQIKIFYYTNSFKAFFIEFIDNVLPIRKTTNIPIDIINPKENFFYMNISNSLDYINKTINFNLPIKNGFLRKFENDNYEIIENKLLIKKSNILSFNKNIIKKEALFENPNYNQLVIKNAYVNKLDLSKIGITNITKPKPSHSCLYASEDLPEHLKNKLIINNVQLIEKDLLLNKQFSNYFNEFILQKIDSNNFYKLGKNYYLEIEKNSFPKNLNRLLDGNRNIYQVDEIIKKSNDFDLVRFSLI